MTNTDSFLRPKARGSTELGTCLMHPASIAVVGASDDAAKTGSRPMRFLDMAGFTGRIYPVNARSSMVMGRQAWSSLSVLPEVPDHVFVVSPTATVQDIVAECVALGVPVVTVLAGGFGESGDEGKILRQRLEASLANGATRLIGPNSIGVVNTRTGLMLTANAAFAEPGMPVGGLFLASHSGSMIGAVMSRGRALGVGFAGAISTGMEIDLSLGEICHATLDDPGIDCYALFLESIQHGEDLRRFAFEAARRGRTVVAYMLGRTPQAAELAQSHTGVLASENVVAEAFLKDCGIARVETLEGLLRAPALLRKLGPPVRRERSVQAALVTTTGAGGSMVVDQLALRGGEVVGPQAEILDELARGGVTVSPGRIVDLTLAGTRPEAMATTLELLLAAPEFDTVLAVAGSSARHQPELLVPSIQAAATGSAKPVVAFVTPDAPEALRTLTLAGVPCSGSPETCADIVAAAYARRPARAPVSAVAHAGQVRLDEARGYERLAAMGIAAAEHTVVPTSTEASPLLYPVAVKLLSANIVHKSDIGGVKLSIASDGAFATAVADIVRSVRQAHPEEACDSVLVQRMTPALGEVLLSYRVDREAGPFVMLAAGGTDAEIHADRTVRPAPVDIEEAWAMMAEVRALRKLEGFRGTQRGDMAALAQAIVSLSHAPPEIVEAEINPLLVLPEGRGVKAVDAVITVGTASAPNDLAR
ncbi:acetate--CoA ligase family protein [Sphingobium sp. V4]|uniref:acetate--CoA ligase family protein n=1 Tax=Sphingobium sp. V4 TaxID=3038927 RepID=UPI002557D2CA|nr:acetate--CoA ligase family protein [Sphingobium sp. V4]WIW89427.1 acetate--CoA ligase family protein [Sphingobium sp. V4]